VPGAIQQRALDSRPCDEQRSPNIGLQRPVAFRKTDPVLVVHARGLGDCGRYGVPALYGLLPGKSLR